MGKIFDLDKYRRKRRERSVLRPETLRLLRRKFEDVPRSPDGKRLPRGKS